MVDNTKNTDYKPQDIKEVFETDLYNKANDYLKLGWILIDTYKTSYEPVYNIGSHQTMHYVLAWIKPEEPVYPKSKYPISTYSDPFPEQK